VTILKTRSRCPLTSLAVAMIAAVGPALAEGVAGVEGPERTGLKVISLPMRTDGPKNLDPALGSTVYDNMGCSQIYETLLETKYTDTKAYQPLLLTELPTTSDGGTTWHFRLKEGVRFQDDPCFAGGKGREMVAGDVFYSWKRLADKKNGLKNWWLIKDTILGFDAFKDAQNAAETFDYDAPVEGFRTINDHEFEVVLARPVYRFLWTLTMFQTSVVPREAVEYYGLDFPSHPVGTGPFVLDTWVPKSSLTLNRNPTYHGGVYPSDWSEQDKAAGLGEAAGTPLPIPDRIEFTMYVQDQPMWLQFDTGRLALTQVPAENFEMAFNKRSQKLKRTWRKRGIKSFAVPLLDFIFIGFNMEDPLLGGYDDAHKWLRQALSLALDWDERNDTFYNRLNIIYDGPIPPGLDGYPEGGRAPVSYRGPDIQRARELLAKAGYPGGEGLPPIQYFTNRGGNSSEQTEMLKRQLAKIGVRLDVQLVDFSTLIQNVNNKKAPMFSFAWSSDYPDAENNLALFYSPNVSPGSNHYNYNRPEYDRLYEQILVMPPSPERTKIYEKMRDMIIEDAPYMGSMARTRHYLVQPWLRNAKPTERYWGWYKYLDVDESKR